MARAVDGRSPPAGQDPLTVAVVATVCAVVLAVAAAAYWMLVVSEGAYLGPGLVTFLYDRSAESYDALKDVPRGWDQERLAEPLLARFSEPGGPARVMDFATGTARLPMALLAEPDFTGHVVGLDLSGAMLGQAWRKVGGWSPRAQLVRAPVVPAPFAEASFDVVSMLEALEFTPHPRATLAEMVRLLAPGGTLLVTNRVGWESRLLPFRAIGRDAIVDLLRALGLQRVVREPWQTHYDLIWAWKPGREPMTPAATVAGDWVGASRCPLCGGSLFLDGDLDTLRCRPCSREVRWHDGYWDFIEDRRTRGRRPGPPPIYSS